MNKILVNKVIKSSIVDGPGNRIAIFVQGCNFDCWYCHNPETINICNSCYECISACDYSALLKLDKLTFNQLNCTNCNKCVETCKFDSSPKINTYTVSELYNLIEPYFDFVDGITFSGGEATLYQDFITEFYTLVKEFTNLSLFVDTNGGVELKTSFINAVDYFMLDIKAIENEEHLKLTGQLNEIVLKNFDKLIRLSKLYEVRTVIYPGHDHTNTIEFVKSKITSEIKYKEIEFHKEGVRAKYLK